MTTSPQRDVTWVLEAGVFPDSHEEMVSAVEAAGGEVVLWDDAWWRNRRWPGLPDRAVVFHGSLGNADRIRREIPWRPGAYCNADAFRCSAWYPRAARWLLHQTWKLTTVRALVADPIVETEELDTPYAVFVRPDSALKPFHGRIVEREALSLAALDHGFSYADDSLPVMVAPVRSVRREWRFVVVDREVVAGSGYEAGRTPAQPEVRGSAAWRYAAMVAAALEPPEEIYVLDACEADDQLHLLELNPFSGADLYACDREAVVAAVSAMARSSP